MHSFVTSCLGGHPRLKENARADARVRTFYPLRRVVGKPARLCRFSTARCNMVDRYDRFQLPSGNRAYRYSEHEPYDPDPLG